MTFLATMLAKYAFGRWLQANWGWVKYALIAAAVLTAFLAYRSSLIEHGRELERAEWEARQQAAQAQAQADSWELVDMFAAVDVSVAAAKSETAKSEVKFRDRIIRTAVDVYRDNPVCRPPDSLWRANDQYAADLAAIAKLGVVTVQPFDGAGQR